MNGFYNTCGACGVMGTANSVQSMAEALGMALPGTATIPAVYAQRIHAAEATGIKIMELVEKDIKPRDIMTQAAFENAIKVLMATGASTNLVIHLIAIARRAGIHLTLDDFDRLSKDDALHHRRQALRRCHRRRALPRRRHPRRDEDSWRRCSIPSVMTCQRPAAGREPQERQGAQRQDHPPARPTPSTAMAACASCAARWRPTAPSSRRRPASPACSSTPARPPSSRRASRKTSTATLPISAPTMSSSTATWARSAPRACPRSAPAGLPRHLLQQGVRDMVRITDARMSGTSYGTDRPARGAGGGHRRPAGCGPGRRHDRAGRRERHAQPAGRRARDQAPPGRVEARPRRSITQGYRALWIDQVLQAPDGCDFKFCAEKDWLLKR